MNILLLLAVLPVVYASVLDNEVAVAVNDRPIIGILAEEYIPRRPEWKKYKSFISASYVKFIEAAGAQVAPIWINRNRSYYEEILSQINGVLFPGGSASFDARNGYGEAGSHIYDIAHALNRNGEYFPLWGTCLGFEFLAYMGANRSYPLANCLSMNVNLKLEFLNAYKQSKLFGSAPSDIIQILQNDPVTPNAHMYCLTQENLTRFMGDVHWRVLSVNEDSKGLRFVSSMESRDMPAYGVQFHPEKILTEWAPRQTTAHSYSAVQVAQYFANFFVNEARKSLHSFPSYEAEKAALIYNFRTTFTGLYNYTNEELYLFE